MKRRWRTGASALVLCLATTFATAAGDGAAPLPPPIEPEVATAAAELEALNAEQRAAQNAWRKEYTKRRTAANGAEFEAPPRVEGGFQRKFADAAARYAGTEDAVPFLLVVAGLGRSADKQLAIDAVETLASTHVESEKLSGMTFTLLYGVRIFGEQGVEVTATRIADATPHADVKSAMLFLRGALVQRRGTKDSEESADAVADFEAAMAAAPESRYAKMSQGAIFELQNLQIGMTAPDIEGNDLDGVAFKLSDYRGKVVVIDFWGDW